MPDRSAIGFSRPIESGQFTLGGGCNGGCDQNHGLPAIQKVFGMDPAGGPQPTITEFPVHHYVKP